MPRSIATLLLLAVLAANASAVSASPANPDSDSSFAKRFYAERLLYGS